MCRLMAYCGPPRTLHELLLEAPHSLEHQSYEPREQQHGVVNADGFGVAWYHPSRPEPACYRTIRPIWSDQSFASMAGVIDSETVVAAVRSATPPAATEESGTQPFTHGPWSFLHNGYLDDFRSTRGVALRRSLSFERAAAIASGADSEVLFALVLDAIDRGADPSDAVAEVVTKLRPGNLGGLNLVLARQRHLVATRAGNSLHTLRRRIDGREAFYLASEPFDDDPEWAEVPDGSVVELEQGRLSIRTL